MKSSEIERFKLSWRPSAVHSLGDSVLFWKKGSGELYCAGKDCKGDMIAALPSITPLGMSLHDGYIYFIDLVHRCLFRMDLKTLKPEKIADLKQLHKQVVNLNPALLASGSKIRDIHIFGYKLFIAVEAGYSSGIYAIDIGGMEPMVETFFYSMGVAPRGLTSDPNTRNILVADAREGYLFEFDNEGVDIRKPIKLPTNSPSGLSINQDRTLHVGVGNAPEVIGFSIGEARK